MRRWRHFAGRWGSWLAAAAGAVTCPIDLQNAAISSRRSRGVSESGAPAPARSTRGRRRGTVLQGSVATTLPTAKVSEPREERGTACGQPCFNTGPACVRTPETTPRIAYGFASNRRATMADDVLEQPKSRHTPSVDSQHGYEAEVDDAEGRGEFTAVSRFDRAVSERRRRTVGVPRCFSRPINVLVHHLRPGFGRRREGPII